MRVVPCLNRHFTARIAHFGVEVLAVDVYERVQGRFPLHKNAPDVQQKIVTAFERDRNFESATASRALLASRQARLRWCRQLRIAARPAASG